MSQSHVPTCPKLDILTETVNGYENCRARRNRANAGDVRLGPARRHPVCGETDWAADHSTAWFNPMTTNLQLCLDQASSRSESAAFVL